MHRSLLHLGEELLHGLYHFDAKGLRTLPLLVARPGVLTRRYIDGQRMRYVSPLALFLFMVFVMFFAASLTSGGMTDGAATPAAATGAAAGASDASAAGLRTWHAAAPATGEHGSVPAWALELREQPIDTGSPALDTALRRAADNPDLAIYKLKGTAYKYSFLLVPISLPFLWSMFFWHRGVTMYDHAVFALYSLSFMSLLLVSLMVLAEAHLGAAVPWLACLVPPLHMGLQLRDAYRLGRWGTAWRTCALLVVSAVVLAVYVVLIVFLTMG